MDHFLNVVWTLTTSLSWRALLAAAIFTSAAMIGGLTGHWWLILVGIALCWLPYLGVKNPQKL